MRSQLEKRGMTEKIKELEQPIAKTGIGIAAAEAVVSAGKFGEEKIIKPALEAVKHPVEKVLKPVGAELAKEGALGYIPQFREAVGVKPEEMKVPRTIAAIESGDKEKLAEEAISTGLGLLPAGAVVGKIKNIITVPATIKSQMKKNVKSNAIKAFTRENINLGRITTTNAAIDEIAGAAKILAEKVGEKSRGVVSNQELQKLADDAGLTLQKLTNRTVGTAWNAETTLAARQGLAKSAEEVAAARKAYQLTPTGENLNKFQNTLETHYKVQTAVSGLTAEAGRLLQQFNIYATPKEAIDKAIAKFLKKFVPLEGKLLFGAFQFFWKINLQPAVSADIADMDIAAASRQMPQDIFGNDIIFAAG